MWLKILNRKTFTKRYDWVIINVTTSRYFIRNKFITNWINNNWSMDIFLTNDWYLFQKLPAVTDLSKFDSDLWTGPFTGVVFERKFLLLPVYVFWPIYFYLILDTKGREETNAALIISMSLILIFFYWYMNISPTKIPLFGVRIVLYC